jgi:VIT1/CCC1 family predicted Fe2+/Mn2+ transporter
VPMSEANGRALEKKLNWLRAAVLGANDGIVSVAGMVMGVAGAGADRPTVLLAGIAALVAGSISMGGGEYVSVSAQRDTEISYGRTAEEVNAHPWGAVVELICRFRSRSCASTDRHYRTPGRHTAN